jgi:hypothetical protein
MAVSALCALSLVLAVFAHQPVLSGSPGDPELTQYALPDGSLPTICHVPSGSEPAKSAARDDCPFCRIAASIALPKAPTAFVPCAISLDLDFGLPDDDQSAQQAFFADAPPRGPPAGSLNS